MFLNLDRRVVIALALCGTLPAVAAAQSGIVGVARDADGLVLPGVMVDATSPALIEKVRSVVTDGQGLYRFVDLRPGTYTITMTLPGFSTFQRDRLELPAGFTATVNAELKVGELAETITVVSESPTVDTQSVTQAAVFSKALLETLPSASRTPQSFAAFIPGVVGGLNVYAVAQKSLSIHGGRPGEYDTRIDGFSETGPGSPGGGGSTFYVSPITVQETSVSLSGHSAEYQMNGVMNNIVPKEGGNRFAGSSYATYNDEDTAWSNFSDALRAQGVTAISKTKQNSEVAAAFGGPLDRDRLWFFTSVRVNNLYRYLANLYEPRNPLAWVYEPDLSKPAFARNEDRNYTGRLTWQPNPKHKVSAALDWQPHWNHHRDTAAFSSSSTVSIEASTFNPHNPNYLGQVVWKSPISNHLLFDAGVSFRHNGFHSQRQITPIPTAPDTIAAIDRFGLIPGLQFRASSVGYNRNPSDAAIYRGSASYVSGAHEMKVGATMKRGRQTSRRELNQDVVYTLNNGSPLSVQLNATPTLTENRLNADLGIFVTDEWRLGRMTMNLGARYDYLNATAVGVDQPAGRFVGARSFDDVTNVPNWHDFSTRVGMAYDLFGTGRTAVKASWNRYLAGVGTAIASANNPVTTSVVAANRNWSDANRDYVPDCDFTNTAPNGECGPLSDLNFGLANPRATRSDVDVLEGYGKRPYNWEVAASIEHQVRPGMSASIGYFRRYYGNFTVTDNQAVSPADFDPYCITAPIDPRLPAGVSGSQICGLYDVRPARFGAATNFITFADRYGTQTEVFNGVDLSSTVRLPAGVQASGGVSFGRTRTNRCFVVDSPEEMRFCDVTTPYLANIKALGVVPLPWGLQTSATFQSVPGPMIRASFTASNAAIRPSLGRDLASGANGTTTVELIQPGTVYSPRVNQVDLSLGKTLRLGGRSLRGTLNVINLLNADDIQEINLRYAPTAAWPQPTVTLDGRFLQFMVQVDF